MSFGQKLKGTPWGHSPTSFKDIIQRCKIWRCIKFLNIYMYIYIYIYIHIYIYMILMKCHFHRVLNKKSYLYTSVWITINLCLCSSKFRVAHAIFRHGRYYIIFLLRKSKKRKHKISINYTQYKSILSLFLLPLISILANIFLFSCLHLLINSNRLFNKMSSWG